MILEKFLKSNDMTRDEFGQIIAKDADFFSKYISWGDTDAETELAPKACDRLLELKNGEPERFPWDDGYEESAATEPSQPVTEAPVAESEAPIMAEPETAEPVNEPIAEEPKNNVTAIELSEDQDENVEIIEGKRNEQPNVDAPEPKKRGRKPGSKSASTKQSKGKKKKSVTKAYLAEHGMAGDTDIRTLREFLMFDGVHTVEDVALMSDEEVRNGFTKEYYIVSTDTGLLVFRRSALNSISNEIYLMEE